MKTINPITIYWHDYETWGTNPAIDRPAQFAGIRTDLDLNIIDDPMTLYCRLSPDSLPNPEACLITGLLPQDVNERGLSEREFVDHIYRQFAHPGTCGAGYNSIRFDDEVTRYALYRNFYDPYEREWKNGNSRWDIIDVMRLVKALRPEGIEWPTYEDGTPSFKLEALTAANQLHHQKAHDALSDVYATIALAKLVKERQPRLFDYAFNLRNKRAVMQLIDIEGCRPLFHVSSRFSSATGNAALVQPIYRHPLNKNAVICFNLAYDPTPLLTLSVEELKERLYTPAAELPDGVERLPLKALHVNRSPMITAVNALDDEAAHRLSIDKALCEKHWQVFRDLTVQEREQLNEKLAMLYAESPFTERQDPEQMLYDGFLCDEDKLLLHDVRQASPERLTHDEFPFLDHRLQGMLSRYKARNYPSMLTEHELFQWKAYCYQCLQGAEGRLGFEIYIKKINEMEFANNFSEEKTAILSSLRDYASETLRWAMECHS